MYPPRYGLHAADRFNTAALRLHGGARSRSVDPRARTPRRVMRTTLGDSVEAVDSESLPLVIRYRTRMSPTLLYGGFALLMVRFAVWRAYQPKDREPCPPWQRRRGDKASDHLGTRDEPSRGHGGEQPGHRMTDDDEGVDPAVRCRPPRIAPSCRHGRREVAGTPPARQVDGEQVRRCLAMNLLHSEVPAVGGVLGRTSRGAP